ncbi:CIC11C00000000765 [Sungouiella intermedia]|uniref:CIC11C00000000765 n=1 Tax=Sungouiella intermedia TaxID=45354 RepID=A0A1L0BEC7_9ASCO|nr:CIC11C00000000765 [[Candida] intermedia]
MKIEEIEGPKPEKKNPFAQRKKTTVKRERDDVYPERKGLNKPDFVGESPLDVLFAKLEKILDKELPETTVESVYVALFTDNFPDDLELARYKVVDQLLDYLLDIQKYAMAAKEASKTKDLISISLHDIKTFAKLVNVIIMLGIYPAIGAFSIGIPFEKRRLSDFGKKVFKPIKISPIAPSQVSNTATNRFSRHSEMLQLVYRKLYLIFSIDSDVRELLLKGSGYSDFMTVAITLITVPYFEKSVRASVSRDYEHITSFAATYELYQDYTLLINTPSPSYFKQFVMDKLQLLPSSAPKGDGVLTVVEFVLGLRDQEEIKVEKLDHVASILLLKPKSLTTIEYFTSIGNQCYDILVNINRPTISTTICHFMEKLWLKNPRVVQDFFLKRIWENLNPPSDSTKLVLVGEIALNNNINVLISLTQRGLTSDLLVALFMPISVPLWLYYAFLRSHDKPSDITQNIIVGFLTLVGDSENFAVDALDSMAKNLVSDGGEHWKFRLGPNQLVEICPDNEGMDAVDAEKKVLSFIKLLDSNCKLFVELLKQVDHEVILKLFVRILSRWLKDQSVDTSLGDENPFVKLIDLRLLESIGNEFKDRLAQSPFDILDLVSTILQYRVKNESGASKMDVDEGADSDDEDSDDEQEDSVNSDVVSTVLELLSAIILESNPAEIDERCRDKLKVILRLLKSRYLDLSTAKALGERISLLLNGEAPTTDETEAQRRILTRAITNLNDPLVPIRAHGLYLLRQLVEQQSSVLTVDFVVNLHLMQLKDPEPFIYLNVIKGLGSLLEWNAGDVLPILLLIYTNTDNSDDKDKSETKEEKTENLDERLRIGEVLLRYVQQQDEAFTGQNAKMVFNAALKLIRRPANDADKIDDLLRMSAMSILGVCCSVNPLGVYGSLELALDCALGILDLETGKDSAIMRRSAVVLIYDLIAGTSKTDKVPFPKLYRDKVLTLLRYAVEQDNDLLVREQAQDVLNYIEELVRIAMDVDGA